MHPEPSEELLTKLIGYRDNMSEFEVEEMDCLIDLVREYGDLYYQGLHWSGTHLGERK